jgi:hypothetical protein
MTYFSNHLWSTKAVKEIILHHELRLVSKLTLPYPWGMECNRVLKDEEF